MKFPYSKYRCPKIEPFHTSPATYRPIIEIIAVYGSKSLRLNALLDTGADFNLFPLEVAEALEVNLSGCPTVTTYGICGQLRTFFTPMRVKIEEGRRIHKIDTFVGFADAPTPLLGQNGFFDRIKSSRFIFPDYFELIFSN